METMSFKRYEFINKVYEKKKTAIGIVLKIIAFIIVGLVLLFILLGFLITGLGFLLPICGGIFALIKVEGLESKKVEHIQVRAIIDFYSDSVVMRYDYIDREDDMGPRSEEYTFYYRDIIDLEFSVPQQCLNIKCGPLLRMYFYRDSKEIEKDYRMNKRYYRNLIYLPSAKRDEFLKDIQKYSGISVTELH